jgi:pimeloyl-ACP methyl ester carboxylesterase
LKMTTDKSISSNSTSAAVMNTILKTGTASQLSDNGTGQTILMLHGGGGVATVAGISGMLSEHARMLVPTHPGFDGTPRPEHLHSVTALAQLYLELLADLGLKDVVVIGSSLGGWIAAEMAASSPHVIKGVVLLNPVGIEVPGETVLDVSTLPRPELIRLANHNPELILKNMPPMTPERLTVLAANAEALHVYDNGAKMMSAGLRERLAGVAAPALVLWGESDGIVPVNYGRGYARAFGSGEFQLIQEAGHLPQLEQPASVLAHIERYLIQLNGATNRTALNNI